MNNINRRIYDVIWHDTKNVTRNATWDVTVNGIWDATWGVTRNTTSDATMNPSESSLKSICYE